MDLPHHGRDRVGAGKKSGDVEVCITLHHLDVFWRYLSPGVCAKFFSFRMKLRNHQLLLNQMSSFDVRAAKCTLLADRSAIEEQVVALFEGRTVPLKEGSGVDDGEARCFTCRGMV